jgi:hypothetical protein
MYTIYINNMDPEKRKIYNEKYYNSNRLAILAGLNKKVKCEKCGRVVTYSRLNFHKETKLCKKFSTVIFV